MSENTDKNKKQVRKRNQWEIAAFISGIGIYFVVILAICIFLGRQAAELWSIRPFGTIFGIVIGFPIGFYSIYKKITGNF